MKRHPITALLVLFVSGLIGLSFSVFAKKTVSKNNDKKGELFIDINGDVTCRPGTSEECMVSDCEAPNISTGCDDPHDDEQTTLNDLPNAAKK